MSETKKGELAIRDKAILHQQRRLKQATQFTHKDSADLLPLDGLKRLGTSKDLQPHSIVQRRLLEGNITRLRGEGARDPGARVRSPLADNKDGAGGEAEERSESTADDSTEERESLEESERSLRSDEDDESSEAAAARPRGGATDGHGLLTALVVQCKCCETEVKASVDTGSRHNHISASCCRRLGLAPVQESSQSSVTGLKLQLGRRTVQCSAYVKEDETFELCLGLQTLLDLQCCLDFSRQVLKLQSVDEDGSGEDQLPFLTPPSDSQCQHDTNENL